MNNNIYNFSPGPTMLPKEILTKIKKEIYNFEKSGVSIMEINHRHPLFIKMLKKTKKLIKEIMNVPKNYTILFCHGGARGQFSALPLNLFKKNEIVDYIISGYWSKTASKEGEKYCKINNIDIRIKKKKINSLIPPKQWKLTKKSKYVHYCQNETVDGLLINSTKNITKKKILLADFSSSILTKKINIKNFGVIYASAQKNLGISGVTIVIIRTNLLNKYRKQTPSILNYTLLKKHQSIYNTPCTFSLYVSNMMLNWIKKKGGINKIEKMNKKKAKMIYNIIDLDNFYKNKIDPNFRSLTNIVFKTRNEKLDKKFIYEAEKNGLLFLKGHRVKKGIRASIYNSMPIQGVKKLTKFMIKFKKKNQFK